MIAPRGLPRAASKGFTLIEVLVALVLTVILIATVTKIFVDTTELAVVSEARNTVYGNARFALDQMATDLHGVLSFNGGYQRFIMQNGKTSLQGDIPGGPDPASGSHVKEAADFLKFRTTTQVGNTTQTAEISYHLIPGNMVLRSSSGGALPDSLPPTDLDPGDTTRGKTKRKPERPLYTLVRQMRVQDPANPQNWDQVPKDSNDAEIPDQELAYFIVSMNIEYLADDASFSQLDAPLQDDSPCPPSDPLGEPTDEDSGSNDGGKGGTALRILALRVTLVIVEDVAARQERVIQRVIWIPMG